MSVGEVDAWCGKLELAKPDSYEAGAEE